MIKIILSLFILAITFTGLACASASSDFNVETVEMDQDIYGINETIDIIDENDEVVEVNGNYEEEAAEVIINDTHEDKKK